MRKSLLIIALTLAAKFSFAQTRISIDYVNAYMGQKVEVCSKVYGVKATEKITFINLGAAFPNAPLTVVIFAKDFPNFKGSV